MHGVMLAPTASTGIGASIVFSCIDAPDAGPSIRATLETSTHTISPRDGGAGQGIDQREFRVPNVRFRRPGTTKF
jgi:hypothetical protein